MNQSPLSCLADVPFEKILNYLSLEERIHLRLVSRRWCHTINNLRPTRLCYARRERGFIFAKNRLISGAFAQNFIYSPNFDVFFDTFGSTILSGLKHLRICELDLSTGMRKVLMSVVNTFDRLEALDLLRFSLEGNAVTFRLVLPMLNSLYLEDLDAVKKIILVTPRLSSIKILDWSSSFSLEIEHPESVRRLTTWELARVRLEQLTNLTHLYLGQYAEMDYPFLTSLQQLEEIHLADKDNVRQAFKQKESAGRYDLKIFYCGLQLTDPGDQALDALSCYYPNDTICYLAKNTLRLASEIAFSESFAWAVAGDIPPGYDVNVFKRFIKSDSLIVNGLVRLERIDRFLHLVNSLNIASLAFDNYQEPDLFDQFTENCTIQKLFLYQTVYGLEFLPRLKHLICLQINFSIEYELVEQILKNLEFLLQFEFNREFVGIYIKVKHPFKRFDIRLTNGNSWIAFDVDDAVRFVVDATQPQALEAYLPDRPSHGPFWRGHFNPESKARLQEELAILDQPQP